MFNINTRISDFQYLINLGERSKEFYSPKLSLKTLAMGARKLVVQEALEIILSIGSQFFSLTPITYMGASAEGAEMTTFFAPTWKRL